MYKKILFGTCLSEYCDHIFNYMLNIAKDNEASLWIYYGLGRLKMNQEQVDNAIRDAEARVAGAYVERIKAKGLTDYKINVSDGDVASEMTKLARNASMDVIVMGTSTKAPISIGEDIKVGPLGPVVSETILWAPCPVLVIPPSLIPGLAHG